MTAWSGSWWRAKRTGIRATKQQEAHFGGFWLDLVVNVISWLEGFGGAFIQQLCLLRNGKIPIYIQKKQLSNFVLLSYVKLFCIFYQNDFLYFSLRVVWQRQSARVCQLVLVSFLRHHSKPAGYLGILIYTCRCCGGGRLHWWDLICVVLPKQAFLDENVE